jgi:hypothetical protein
MGGCGKFTGEAPPAYCRSKIAVWKRPTDDEGRKAS